MTDSCFDTVVVGGGVMGCTVAFRLAAAGQKVALVEKGGLCMQASGVNAGTLSIQIKRAALIPYAMRGWELWRTTTDWLGAEVGFAQRGGLTLALTAEEAEMLEQRMAARRDAGAPIEMVGANRAREIEAGLSENVVLASWCALDGYANSNELGQAFRAALRSVGTDVREFTAADAIAPARGGYEVRTASGTLAGRRIVIAGGVWIEQLLERDFGVRVPVETRTNMISVTERLAPVVHTIVGVASGLLTLKQSKNGTVLIGGGWQGKGDPERGGYEIVPENLIGNLRLAHYAVPALREARIVRTWLGLEAASPDGMPLVGEIPGAPDAYVIGAVRGGYTIGPCMGSLLAQRILGQEPDLPLFDPTRCAS